MATRQFVQCKFRESDRKSYCYHNDGEPLAVGDKVKLPAARGEEGWLYGHVVEVDVKEPTRFATKGVIEKVQPEPEGDDA